MKTQQERADVYQKVTDQIIAAIEQGVDAWHMPWHHSATTPKNAVTGKAYRGVNVLSLWATASSNHYRSGIWATYAQWQELGAQVRKGEKSAFIVFWKFPHTAEETEEGEESENRRGPIAYGYNVFNADQVDGYSLPDIPVLPPTERIESADRFFAALNADVRHGGGRAYYNKTEDFIQLPPFEVFKEATAYYATFAHECIHWVGASHRLNRDLKGRFGDEAYAAEELVAELGAAFLCADLNVENQPRPDHAAYIQNWVKVLRNDKHAIFTAASKAQSAADWLHSPPSMTDSATRYARYAA